MENETLLTDALCANDETAYEISDSGERQDFDTGAKRDTEKDKGRFDLLPLMELSVLTGDSVYYDVLCYRRTNDQLHLYRAFMRMAQTFYDTRVKENGDMLFMNTGEASAFEVINALAVHYAKGAEKYSARNWELGLPVSRFISSALRHYTKAVANIEDGENHKVAALWNILGAIYTTNNHSDLNDFVNFEYVKQQLEKQEIQNAETFEKE